MKKNVLILLIFVMISTIFLTSCGQKEQKTVRIGIMKNITHAPGLVALDKQFFKKHFGDNVEVEVTPFNNGTDVSIALANERIDIGYVGPGPATVFYSKSKNFRIISGVMNGGAVLVARADSGIETVKDLVGKVVAIPSIGNTQDISLRMLLKQENILIAKDGSGVELITRPPSDTVTAFRQKETDAAILPEPWGTVAVDKAGAKIIADWNQIPPLNGRYPTTVMVASDKFIREHKELMIGAIQANMEAMEFMKKNPEESYESINQALKSLASKPIDIKLIKAALAKCTLTTDVDAKVLEEMASAMVDAKYIKNITVESIGFEKFIDLSMMKEVSQHAAKNGSAHYGVNRSYASH